MNRDYIHPYFPLTVTFYGFQKALSRCPENFGSGFQMSLVLQVLKYDISDNAHESFDFPTVGENIYRSNTEGRPESRGCPRQVNNLAPSQTDIVSTFSTSCGLMNNFRINSFARLLPTYFRLFWWRLSAPYGLDLRAPARLARTLVRPWERNMCTLGFIKSALRLREMG
jgi:hypothetical protein